jgi:hypothetical protein
MAITLASQTALIVVAVILGSFLLADVIVDSINLKKTDDIEMNLAGLVPALPPVFGGCPANEARRQEAYQVRIGVAFNEYSRSIPCHTNNGDEVTHPTYLGQFTKGMLHDASGVVISSYYQRLLTAVGSGAPSDFSLIPLAPGATRKYTNPQSGLAFALVGGDPASFIVPPAFAFSSAEQAGEYMENAWMALCRDVPFDEYGINSCTLAAINELNGLGPLFKGTTPVTPDNLFRSKFVGAQNGPYISQFMYLPANYGINTVDQRLNPPLAGLDYMTNFTEFLRVQNGQTPAGIEALNGTLRFMYTGRDISHWVHKDMLFQAYHVAAMILMGTLNVPFNPTNPYLNVAYSNQDGFGTFGGPMVSSMVTEVATRALQAVWYQKWFVHRRLRPEAYGGFVDRNKNAGGTFPIHSSATSSQACTQLNAKHGSCLIPQAFPEGSPLHPSYGAGHATVSAACVTILKALFDGSYVIPSPVMPDPLTGGQTLTPYVGPALTVEGELNKVSANVGIGRNIAGVHWRSDYDESVKLGEQVAIQMLKDYKPVFNEGFVGWSFKGFEGNVIYI